MISQWKEILSYNYILSGGNEVSNGDACFLNAAYSSKETTQIEYLIKRQKVTI